MLYCCCFSPQSSQKPSSGILGHFGGLAGRVSWCQLTMTFPWLKWLDVRAFGEFQFAGIIFQVFADKTKSWLHLLSSLTILWEWNMFIFVIKMNYSLEEVVVISLMAIWWFVTCLTCHTRAGNHAVEFLQTPSFALLMYESIHCL